MQNYDHVHLTKNGILLAVCILVAALANQVIAQSVKPHPWMANAPGEFVRLINRGNVKMVLDDDCVQKAGKTAYCLSVRHRLRFQISPSVARF